VARSTYLAMNETYLILYNNSDMFWLFDGACHPLSGLHWDHAP
jgi:hypothetical protein